MKNKDFALLDGKQHTSDPIARQIASHFPQTIAHRTAKRHSNRPSVLNSHQVLPDCVAVTFLQATEPASYYFPACGGSVKDDRHLAWPVSGHIDL
jgi:hypothetical protein